MGAKAEPYGVFADLAIYVHGFKDGAFVFFGGTGAAGGNIKAF